MGGALGILTWEVRATWRALLPARWLRWSVAGSLAAFCLCLSVALLAAPLAVVRGGAVGGLTGFLAANLGLAASLSIAAVAALLRRPERVRLMLLAPLPPAAAVWLPLAAVLASALVPLAVIFLPFVLAFFRIDPGTAWRMLAAGLALAAWAVVIGVFVPVALARRYGRDKAARLAFAAGAFLGMGALLGLGFLLRLDAGPRWINLFLLATALAVPPWARHLAHRLLALLTAAEPAILSPEPAWDSPPWWRLLARTPAWWGLLGVLPVVLWLLLSDGVPLRWGSIAFLLILLEMVPLGHLFAPEYECPDRFRLAPESAAVQRSILLRIGVPFAAAALALAVGSGWGSWGWVGAVAALLVATPFSFTLFAQLPRKLGQGALLLLAFMTEFLR